MPVTLVVSDAYDEGSRATIKRDPTLRD